MKAKSMTDSKYDRSISMQCLTCGGEDFETNTSDTVKCSRCGRSMSKVELREANSTRIEHEIANVKAEVLKDVKDDLSRIFRKWK